MRIQTNPTPAASSETAAGRSSLLTPGNVVLALTVTAWVVILALIGSHRIFLTNDSVNNYAHVWYAADRIWGGHGIPLHMPVIGHGDAYAFPYGFVPWLSAALVRPLFGDWTVTLWLILGFVGRRRDDVVGVPGDPQRLVVRDRPRRADARRGAGARSAAVPVGDGDAVRRDRAVARRPRGAGRRCSSGSRRRRIRR